MECLKDGMAKKPVVYMTMSEFDSMGCVIRMIAIRNPKFRMMNNETINGVPCLHVETTEFMSYKRWAGTTLEYERVTNEENGFFIGYHDGRVIYWVIEMGMSQLNGHGGYFDLLKELKEERIID